MVTSTSPTAPAKAKAPLKSPVAKPKPAAKAPTKTPLKAPAKAPVKALAKAAAKTTPAKTATPKTASAATAAAAAAADKPKKPKLVRDSYTIPKLEYQVLDSLKQRSAKLGHSAKKSELLRAGLKALAAMDDTALLRAVRAVPTIKTGRPKA